MKVPLEQRFRKTYQDFIRKPKIQKYIANLKKKQKTLLKRAVVLEKFMLKEYLDIESIEKKGLQSTFKSFLGTLEEALDKERQEYLLAVLNFQANEKELKAIEYQLDILSKKLIQLADVENRFKKLKNRYFLNVNLNNKTKAKKIGRIKESVIKLQSAQAEIRQAKKAGLKTEEAIDKLRVELEKIDHWGYANPKIKVDFGGRGRNSTYKKKRYIDRTKTLTFKLNGLLNRYEEELSDVSNSLRIDFSGEIKSIQNFLDLFFDNLITDWIVKSKIDIAFMSLEMIYDKIVRIDRMLNFENERIQKEIDQLLIKETEILLED